MRTFALSVLVLAGAACAPREGAPDAAYRTFARAVADRDADRAWALLSSDTQAWLDARAAQVAAAAPGVVAPSGRQLLLGAAARSAPPVTSVIVARESRDRAVLDVQEEGAPRRQVEMVRERGWRVRIPPPG
jgi:hypothetical protein